MIQATKENEIRTLGAKMAIAFKDRYTDLTDIDRAQVFLEAIDMHTFAYKATHTKKEAAEFSRTVLGRMDRVRQLVAEVNP